VCETGFGQLAAGAILVACLSVAAPAKAADWSGEIGLVTDYRFRGLSLSGSKPALQVSIDAEEASGLYGSLWGSSLDRKSDNRAELDGTLGYAVQITETLTADLSATAYVYPEDPEANAVEMTGQIEAGRGPWTAALGVSVAPPQRGTRDDDGRKSSNVYAFGRVDYALDGIPIVFHAGLGHERGPWDSQAHGGKWDWVLGLEGEWRSVRLGLDAIGSDAGSETLVGSLAVTF